MGLFDLERYADVVDLLCSVLSLEAEVVHERLFREAVQTGWNVRQAARAFGLEPHVYNGEMERFYSETEAFVFELMVTHMGEACRVIDRRVGEAVAGVAVDLGRPLEILALGDGVGTDSLRFAAGGHRVTYFEFEGYSSAVALRRFSRMGLGDAITPIHRVEEVPRGAFDVVINREVLEHVPDPHGVVDDIWGYLRPGGVAVVTESFERVEPSFPTHLRENLRYSRQTPRIFVETGFRLVALYPGGRPMVFQKVDREDPSRFRSLPRARGGFLGRALRRASALVRGVAL